MPANFTIKNIPDRVYSRLRTAADDHHRSINNEVIACLERVLLPTRLGVEERLARAHQLRAAQRRGAVSAWQIARAIRQGRA